jgi:hypothetical protein
MVRNNSPAARDVFSCSGRDLFLVAGRPDGAALAAAVEFVMDQELPTHPFTQEVDGAAQTDKAGGNPENAGRKKLVPMANGKGGAAVKSCGSEYNECGQQGDGDEGGGQIEQGLGCGQPVGLIGAGQRPAKEDPGKKEAARMKEGKKMEVPMKARAVPGHQGVENGRYLPDPQDTDAQDPVQPGHSGKPAGEAKSQATHGFGAFPHSEYGEGCRDQQKSYVTCYMRTEDEFVAAKEGELCQGHTKQSSYQKEKPEISLFFHIGLW